MADYLLSARGEGRIYGLGHGLGAKLDSRLATVLKLYYLEFLSIDEIAEIRDVPPGTVKSRLFYARKLMMKAMEE